jgi:hypothetical protein
VKVEAIMCVSKKTKAWRRSARCAIVVGAIAATTLVGRVSLSSEVGAEEIDQDWRDNSAVKAALDLAADVSPSPPDGKTIGSAGTWMQLTDADALGGPIYW